MLSVILSLPSGLSGSYTGTTLIRFNRHLLKVLEGDELPRKQILLSMQNLLLQRMTKETPTTE